MKKIFWSAIIIVLFSLYFQKSFCDLYSRTYAGGKTAEECITGPRDASSQYQHTATERIEKEGYPAENHLVLTSDNYLLSLQRIPGSSGSKPVLLQHGLTSNSYYWVANGKEQSLPFILADNGFDVWMGNFRGALYARCHTDLTTSDREFWDFSLHEMGVYDLPATINYISNLTNDTIEFVGHSLGTTAFYIFAAEKPDDATKISTMHSFGPVAFFSGLKGLSIPLIYTARLYGPVFKLITAGNTAAILENNLFRDVVYDFYCGTPLLRDVCEFFFFATVGFDWAQFNASKLPDYLNHLPTGIAVKSVYHYAQLIFSGRFQKYDYGAEKNRELYGTDEVPDYNLTSIQVPMAMYKGQSDYFCSLKDVDYLVNLLPNVIYDHLIEYPNFNHMDFVIAMDAKDLLYQDFLKVLNRNG